MYYGHVTVLITNSLNMRKVRLLSLTHSQAINLGKKREWQFETFELNDFKASPEAFFSDQNKRFSLFQQIKVYICFSNTEVKLILWKLHFHLVATSAEIALNSTLDYQRY